MQEESRSPSPGEERCGSLVFLSDAEQGAGVLVEDGLLAEDDLGEVVAKPWQRQKGSHPERRPKPVSCGRLTSVRPAERSRSLRARWTAAERSSAPSLA